MMMFSGEHISVAMSPFATNDFRICQAGIDEVAGGVHRGVLWGDS